MNQQEQIEYWVKTLELLPHPEGGFYKETYRSEENSISGLSLSTSIYFLLTSENYSRFHRIKSDELWFHHAGSPILVHTLDKEKGYTATPVGSNPEKGFQPYFLVKKETIFGSSVLEENSFALVSCVVSPGFRFEDFELFSTEQLLADFPTHETIIRKLS